MHAVEVEQVGKRYYLGEGFHRYRTLREALARPFVRSSGSRRRELWALRDVSFDVEAGDVVGVVGRNGAGKTTLLKLLAHVTAPTEGVVRTRGRVGSLLDVGTGFHPELTGRENIYLNGAILGMTRADVRRRFAEIVAFAEVEAFLDTPLKRYSAGMYLRLAFAVAAHLEPEIVVVDEVLAVGDAEFQRKCLGKMSEFGHEGRTVVFVSHDLGAIERLCRRALWLDAGRLMADGPAEATVDAYLRSGPPVARRTEFAPEPDDQIQLVAVELADEVGTVAGSLRRDEVLVLRISFRLQERVPGLDLGFYVANEHGIRVIEEYWSDTQRGNPARDPGEYEVRVSIPVILPAGRYLAAVWLGSTYDELVHREALSFELLPGAHDPAETLARSRVAQPPLAWEVERLSVALAET